jgi:predicted ester cyclase
MSSEDNNKELARRFLEAFANGDLDTLDEILAPDFVNHSLLPGQAPSRESYIQMAAEKYAAYSDIRHNIEYQATDGDDMVITRHTTHRIHDRGASLGIVPTGREWTFTHIDMHRISGGRVVEE